MPDSSFLKPTFSLKVLRRRRDRLQRRVDYLRARIDGAEESGRTLSAVAYDTAEVSALLTAIVLFDQAISCAEQTSTGE